MPKLEKWTDHGHKLINSEDGQDTSACKISGHSLHAFSGKCPETSPDGQRDRRTYGRTCRKTVTVGQVDQRTHVQVKRGYFRLRTDGRTDRRTDGQPKNIMPPAPKGGGIKIKAGVSSLKSQVRFVKATKLNMHIQYRVHCLIYMIKIFVTAWGALSLEKLYLNSYSSRELWLNCVSKSVICFLNNCDCSQTAEWRPVRGEEMGRTLLIRGTEMREESHFSHLTYQNQVYGYEFLVYIT